MTRGLEPVVYRSAVDRWLLVVLGFGMLLAGTSVAIVLVVGDSAARAIAALAALAGVGLPIWILRATSYTLTGTELLVRSGPFRRRLEIADIVSITPTTNPLSSPALSLNRLRIDERGGRSIMISPADRDRFLADLEARRAAGSGR
jgi:PH (Pleckstrin Homology) domain-containing protein